MPNNNKKVLDIVTFKTKIYLAIIAILLILLCIQNIIFIIPSIIVYALVIVYTFWNDNKRKTEINQHIQEITGNVETAAKNSLENSPFPLILIETDGNVVWKNFKFNNEFANIDIKNILL